MRAWDFARSCVDRTVVFWVDWWETVKLVHEGMTMLCDPDVRAALKHAAGFHRMGTNHTRELAELRRGQLGQRGELQGVRAGLWRNTNAIANHKDAWERLSHLQSTTAESQAQCLKAVHELQEAQKLTPWSAYRYTKGGVS